MKLDCVLTSVNEKEMYIDFIPFFVKAWKILYPSVDVKIILIANEIPKKFIDYKNNIILFTPIKNVLTGFTSQFIRLLYPGILKFNNGILITDIDIIPMNKYYFTRHIHKYDNNKFIYYRENVCFDIQQISICYNVALAKTWSDIFKINSIDDIKNRLTEIFKNYNVMDGIGNKGWGIDQVKLYQRVFEWNKKTNNFVFLKEKETKFKRLNRNSFHFNELNRLKDKIKNGKYTDYHCYRPMNKYKKINEKILSFLKLS